MNDGILRPWKQRRIWSPRTMLLLAILVGATVLTAACSAGSGSSTAATSATSSADAASGTPASSATPASSVPANARQAAQLVSQWTACMRSHGDSGQVTPTIDGYDVIHITIALTVSGRWQGSNGQSGSGGPGPTA